MTTDDRVFVIGRAEDEPSRLTAYRAPPGDDDPFKRFPIVHARLEWREDDRCSSNGWTPIVRFDVLADLPVQAEAVQLLKLEIAKSLSAAGDAVFDWYGDGVLHRVVRNHDGSGRIVSR
jgi:hypothetical protein